VTALADPESLNMREFRHRLLLREVNERIREISNAFGFKNGSFELICECAREECLQRIEVPAPVYERARKEPGRFLVAPGHELQMPARSEFDANHQRVTPK
jgi:hypothetical protein